MRSDGSTVRSRNVSRCTCGCSIRYFTRRNAARIVAISAARVSKASSVSHGRSFEAIALTCSRRSSSAASAPSIASQVCGVHQSRKRSATHSEGSVASGNDPIGELACAIKAASTVRISLMFDLSGPVKAVNAPGLQLRFVFRNRSSMTSGFCLASRTAWIRIVSSSILS
jgi:hypothetical protein